MHGENPVVVLLWIVTVLSGLFWLLGLVADTLERTWHD